MRFFLVGHRGAGKTSLLCRIQQRNFFKGPSYDLDEEIEKKYGKIEILFQDKGEIFFRECENEIFENLNRSSDNLLCVLGAGFDLSRISAKDFVIWVRRETDRAGRIFLDRPRLEPTHDALDEFEIHRFKREAIFRQRANAIYTLPEGKKISESIENKILQSIFNASDKNLLHNNSISDIGIETLSSLDQSQKFSESFLEVRSDQWTNEEILLLQNNVALEYKIYSQRHNNPPIQLDYSKWAYLDWDTQYGRSPWSDVNAEKLILSSHENDVRDGIKSLGEVVTDRVQLKLCPLVQNWTDLMLGYEWWLQEPQKRNFLPRSTDGRWIWFRLWMKGRQKINFWRQGPGEISDQPTLYQWLSAWSKTARFAAVVGQPVSHSFSPTFHFDFFVNKKNSFFAIPLEEIEFEVALSFLQKLGLSFVAVTSPLKKKAYLLSQSKGDAEKQFESINTLTWNSSGNYWQGNNTDREAFAQSFNEAIADLDKVNEEEIIVWGGGGTTNIIRSNLPKAKFIQARVGVETKLAKPIESPAVLIWASSRSVETKWPPHSWCPQLVFDLNYQENSMGLEVAQKYNAKYFSGTRLFEIQALAQQKIWSEYL
ncbi:MAG: shikimate kinase [Bdellovibrionota bacterium]